jgi:MerR family copper efflux transcriptional regulator
MRNKQEIPGTKLLTIGQVAKLASVGVVTIRFYEREGALPRTQRKPSGYRLFDLDSVQRLQFIRKVQDAGFSLKEAGDLVSSKGISAAIRQIDRRIQGLKDLQRELRAMRVNSK